MIEHAPGHTQEETAAIEGGLVRVLQYIQKIHSDNISIHKIARDVVSLRDTEDLSHLEYSAQTIEARKHLEIAKITAFFIERLWPRLHQWNKAHPNDFPVIDPRSGQMRPAKNDELRLLFEKPPYIKAYHSHASIVENTTRRYLRRLDGMLEILNGPPQGEARIYMRYRDLLHESAFHKNQYHGDPIKHISAGFMTGTLFSWAILGKIDSLYTQLKGHNIKDTHTRTQLEHAAEDFILRISRTWLDAFNVINDTLLERDVHAPEGKIAYLPILKHVVLYETAGGDFVFDVDRAGLLYILQEMKRKKREQDMLHEHTTHTMCPALIAAPEGNEPEARKSAIVQLFRWTAEQVRVHKKTT